MRSVAEPARLLVQPLFVNMYMFSTVFFWGCPAVCAAGTHPDSENGSENRPRRFLAALYGLSLGLLLAGAAGEVAAQSRVQPGHAAADPVVVSLVRERGKAVSEEVGEVLIRVQLSRALAAGERVEVPFVISGSGVAPEDFDLTAGGGSERSFDTLTPSLVFDADDSFIWLALDPEADGIDEGGSETITFSLGSDAQFDAPGLETNVAGGADPHATDNRVEVVILDVASTMSVFAEADSLTEGETVKFTFTADPAPEADIVLVFLVYDLGPTYRRTWITEAYDMLHWLTMPANATTLDYSVPTINTPSYESFGSVRLALHEPREAGYKLGELFALTEIVDTETFPALPVATFSSATASVDETAGSTTVGIALSLAAPAALTLNYDVSGTATHDMDYVISSVRGSSGTVSVAKDAMSAAIPIVILDDADVEGDETIVLTLTDGTGYSIGTPDRIEITLRDDDAPPVTPDPPPVTPDPPPVTPEVTLSASPNPVNEGDSVTVTVSISRALPNAVTIPLVLTAGSAEAGDYGALASIEIPANEASGAGEIATALDSDTDDETFTVGLGDLPADVAAGTPASVALRIADNTSVISIESPGNEIPVAFALEQNYPNPFNPSTTIKFALDKTQHVTLSVYDLLGQEVRVLMDGVQPAARYRVSFDASDLASGAYLYVLRTEEQTAVKTMALLK